MATDPSPSVGTPRTRVLRDLALAGAGGLGLSAMVLAVLDLSWPFLAGVVALYLLGSLLILRSVPASLPGPGAGPANRVTFGRAALALPVAALALQPGITDPAPLTVVVVLGGLALLLDGVDGWIARRSGTATAFGARLDMETDAALILALSVVAWRGGPVGPWILTIGALRYLFVAAGKVWPKLERELPPSLRRKTVCVMQGIALLVVCAPWTPDAPATFVGLAALVSLVGSFAVDTVWALRTPLPSPPAPVGDPPRRPTSSPPVLSPRQGLGTAYRVRTRISPSWATEATTSPSRVK